MLIVQQSGVVAIDSCVVLMSCRVNFYVVRSALQNLICLLAVYFFHACSSSAGKGGNNDEHKDIRSIKLTQFSAWRKSSFPLFQSQKRWRSIVSASISTAQGPRYTQIRAWRKKFISAISVTKKTEISCLCFIRTAAGMVLFHILNTLIFSVKTRLEGKFCSVCHD